MKMRNGLLAIVAMFLCFAGMRAAKDPALRRLASVAEKGASVSMRLDDGTTLDAAKSAIRITDERRIKGHGHRKLSPSDLASMSASGSVPAAVNVIYRKDGTIKAVHVRVFASEAAARTFIHRINSRREAMQAAKQNQ